MCSKHQQKQYKFMLLNFFRGFQLVTGIFLYNLNFDPGFASANTSATTLAQSTYKPDNWFVALISFEKSKRAKQSTTFEYTRELKNS